MTGTRGDRFFRRDSSGLGPSRFEVCNRDWFSRPCIPFKQTRNGANLGEPRYALFEEESDNDGGFKMGIKFEGEPPFDLGVAHTISAQVLDATVVVRVTVAIPTVRPKLGSR